MIHSCHISDLEIWYHKTDILVTYNLVSTKAYKFIELGNLGHRLHFVVEVTK